MSADGHLVLEAVTKRFDTVTAVDHLSLSVSKGEFVSLLGPSGCGKTTTLRMVAGFIAPTEGDIYLAGERITQQPPYRRGMGIVFQNYALFPHLNVAENVAFGLEMRRLPKREIAERVEQALAQVRLTGYGKRRIRELSGGQQQRVALARALVIAPSVLLLDEPLSNLDAKLREQMRQEIREIQQDLGMTTLFVTHDQVEALTMSDRIAVLNQGRVEQIGTPEEIYERPATRFVAEFIGRANFLTAEVLERHPHGSRLSVSGGGSCVVPQDLPVAQQVSLMVRPHRIRIARNGTDAGLRGRVRSVTYIGDLIQYDVEVGSESVTVEQPTAARGAERFSSGDSVTVHWEPQDLLIFQDQQALREG